MQKYIRKCKVCKKDMIYKNKYSFKKAVNDDLPCRTCGKRKNGLSNEDNFLFKQMIIDGYFKKEICNKLNITFSQYKSLIAKFNLKTNKQTSINIVDLEKGLAKCSECNKILQIKGNFTFKVKTNGYKYYFTFCNKCKYKKRNARINSNIELFLQERYLHIKHTSSNKKVKFEISKEDFITQYNAQGGLCFYTGLPMICLYGHGKQRDAISVDKIIPALGYVKNNVVFCLNRINIAKHDFSINEIKLWMPDWYLRIMNFMNNLNESKE